jgi:hypothetical protein
MAEETNDFSSILTSEVLVVFLHCLIVMDLWLRDLTVVW